MALINKPNTPVTGDVITAANTNANLDTIYNDYNGNITNANIAASAAIVDTKLAQITTASKVAAAAITGTLGVTHGGTGIATIAQGEVPYGSAADTIAALAVGTAGQFLKTLGAAANPAWAFAFGNAQIISFTRVMDAASSGTAIDYTVSALNPKAAVIIGFQSSAAVAGRDVFGFAEGINSTQMSMSSTDADQKYGSATIGIYAIVDSVNNRQEGTVTFGTNKLSVTWVKVATPPTVTYTFYALCFG